MDATYGIDYSTLYHQHWWWRSRERILLREITSLQPSPESSDNTSSTSKPQILDVGCGNGLFMAKLSQFGEVSGIEVDESLLTNDNPFRNQISSARLGDPSYEGRQFSLVTACDVIEHIEDDVDAVQQMATLLKPGGHLLITVPAFPVLWDHHDEINHHFRRYRRGQITRLLQETALNLQTCRYLFHTIFLPKLAVKTLNAGRQNKVAQHRVPHPWVNRTMQTLCYSEYQVTRALPAPPFGTSILAIAQKPT